MLNVYTTQLGDQEVTLRLTVGGLRKYLKEHTVEGCTLLVSLMAATEDLDAMSALLTQALQHSGNQNRIKSGDELIDALIDSGMKLIDIKTLLLELFEQSGIIDHEGRETLCSSVATHAQNGLKGVAAVLCGNLKDLENDASAKVEASGENPENPT